MYIKNYNQLASNDHRKVVLDLIETAFSSIQPENVLSKNFTLKDKILQIKDKKEDLGKYKRVFLLGFGKGSGGISQIIEGILGEFLTEGFVIDVIPQSFKKIEFSLGTHPLTSSQNVDFTNKVLSKLSDLTPDDLVLVVICGGGSAMFESSSLPLDKIIEVNKMLLQSGADIFELNTIRKHLSKVKGGQLAKLLYPSKVFSLIFSDVLGNDLSTIASGPTVRDKTIIDDALQIYKKYKMENILKPEDFSETPKKESFFEKLENILMVSNITALDAMQKRAKELGFTSFIYSEKFQGEAKVSGKTLLDASKPNSVLLCGGETTVKVKGEGQGGRNQELVLGALPYIKKGVVIASFDSDGWDNSSAAGALGDFQTLKRVEDFKLNPLDFLENNNSFMFFQKVGDSIQTGKLPSNVSDLMIVLNA
jgi:glycerate 2-kinase